MTQAAPDLTEEPGSRALDADKQLARARVAMTVQIGLVVLVLMSTYWMANIADVWARILWLGWAGNLLILAIAWNLRRAFGTIAAPVVAYTVLLGLFTLGQVTLFTLGYTPEDADVLNRENPDSVAKALQFFLPALSLFAVGALAARLNLLTKERRKATATTEGARRVGSLDRRDWQQGLAFTGLVSAVIGVVPFLWSNLHNIRTVWARGYGSYYEDGARIDSPLIGLGYLFVTGLVLLGCSGSARLRRLAIAGLILVSAMRLLSGDRGDGLIYLLTTLMLATATAGSTGTTRRRLAPVAFGLFALVVIPLIGTLRHTLATGEAEVTDTLADQGPLEGTLSNLGATLHPLVKVIELVPGTQEQLNGTSYLAGLAAVLPGPLRPEGLAALVSDPVTGSPATWLMQTLSMSYGPGFTPFAEGYLNFGYVGGCVALFVLGLIMGAILHTPSWHLPAGPVRIAVALTAFALIGFSVRGSFNFVPAFSLRYVILPLLIVALSANTYRRRRLRREACIELANASDQSSGRHQLAGGRRTAEESHGSA